LQWLDGLIQSHSFPMVMETSGMRGAQLRLPYESNHDVVSVFSSIY
jgi:hypothetical protein